MNEFFNKMIFNIFEFFEKSLKINSKIDKIVFFIFKSRNWLTTMKRQLKSSYMRRKFSIMFSTIAYEFLNFWRKRNFRRRNIWSSMKFYTYLFRTFLIEKKLKFFCNLFSIFKIQSSIQNLFFLIDSLKSNKIIVLIAFFVLIWTTSLFVSNSIDCLSFADFIEI